VQRSVFVSNFVESCEVHEWVTCEGIAQGIKTEFMRNETLRTHTVSLLPQIQRLIFLFPFLFSFLILNGI
jgi:hypothetical protein